MIVPTRDTTRYSWLLKLHLKMGFPLFLTGMTGVGKSIISGYTLRSLRNNQIISLSFSSQTSAKETQRKIEDKLEVLDKKTAAGFKDAQTGKQFVMFVDNNID